MSWSLPEHELRTYPRNPLVAVVVQLRFDPILKVGDSVADFQERVRGRFPKYEEQSTQAFDINPALGVRARKETEHRFHTKDGGAGIFLGTQAIGLETRAHIEREALLSDVDLLMKALVETYSTISPLRLGLRYINSISRTQIAADLGVAVAWSDLVAADFISVPCDLADLESTLFGAELTSDMARGKMTLRYGLLREGAEQKASFRLDLDRYLEGGFEVEDIGELLVGFANDIYRVFATAAQSRLKQWMNKGEATDD